MNQLNFKKSENTNLTIIEISNYQELLSGYGFDELNKRILNYIIKNKVNSINLKFSNILNDELSLSKILKIPELLSFLGIKVLSIEISFVNNNFDYY